MRHGTRTINVQKSKLITQIKKNKANHIKEFEKAVVAYKEEALRQLANLKVEVENGSVDAKLNLITPVNNADNYDKILEMFTWEKKAVVQLEQDEFQEYVQDTTDFAVTARMSNSAYLVR
jgi:hypothetical protein